MDSKLVLFQCIALLFRESQLAQRQSPSKETIKEAINAIRLPEASITLDQSREVLVALRSTVVYMVDQPADTVFDHDHIIQRIRLATVGDEGLFRVFEEGLRPLETDDDIKRQVVNLRRDLESYIREIKLKELTKKHYTLTHFSEEPVDWKNLPTDYAAEFEAFVHTGDAKKEGIVDEIDFDDPDSMVDAVTRSLEENAGNGMLSSGWQGLNRMLGGDTFYRRGDFVVVGALQHNFKSGWISSHLRDFAMLNKPYMYDENKKPLLLFITTENSVKDNIMWMYIHLKEMETGEPCDVRAATPQEISDYVKERLSVMGYHIKMLRADPSEYTYRRFFDLVLQLEADGYEIHACLFDYLNMISKRGLEKTHNGSDIRELFRRIRNFCSPRGILFMTPHQLSVDAKGLLRGGVSPEDFVKEIANKGYWDSCKVIDQEVDLEIYIHIVKRDGISYLTVQRGKHRKPKVTAEKDLYFVLRFQQIGGLLPDIGKPDSSLPKVGASSFGEGGELAWYDA